MDELFTQHRLFCPGPTPVPEEALVAGARASIYHRSEIFFNAFLETATLLRPLFGSTENPLILSSSGTGAMEAALQHATAEGDEVVVVDGGKFGQRWRHMAASYDCKVKAIELPWGDSPTVEVITETLQSCTDPKALLIQANETSTGVHYPIEAIARAIRPDFDGLIIVDCISSLGAHPMNMQDWGVDIVVAGSQKGFGIPPGLAFIALSDRAWDRTSSRPKFYFDLKKERQAQTTGQSAYTPATTLLFSLQASLQKLHRFGVEAFADHHQRLGQAARVAVPKLGLELFAKKHPSNSLTAMALPTSIDGTKLTKLLLEEFGFFVAGGQDHLKGKIVRLSHLGFTDQFDLFTGLAGLEIGLRRLGLNVPAGQAVGAAMSSLETPFETSNNLI